MARRPIRRSRANWACRPRAPSGVRTRPAFTRAAGSDAARRHHRDDDTASLMPHLPTACCEPEPRSQLVDRATPAYGVHTWHITATDLFGRVSAPAAISAD